MGFDQLRVMFNGVGLENFGQEISIGFGQGNLGLFLVLKVCKVRGFKTLNLIFKFL